MTSDQSIGLKRGTVHLRASDPEWPNAFRDEAARLERCIADGGLPRLRFEHVGSTAVPGLAAKPIIDLTVVVPAAPDVPVAVTRLASLGYVHQGTLGVEGRDTFQAPAPTPRHHLYLCPRDSLALRNHVAVRDYLRAHPDVAKQYGDLKKQLALRHPDDINAYVAGKTDLIIRILSAGGFGLDELEAIRHINSMGGSVKPPASRDR